MNRKHLFNAIRRLIGRGFRQSEVEELDAAIDAALAGDTTSPPRTIGPAGIRLIRQFEGCARVRRDGLVEAYPDPGTGGAPWTIGWGATGPGITAHTVWTQQQCDARLEADLARYATDVARAIGDAPTTQAQFDALVSFHYNTGAIHRATLTKLHIAGRYSDAAEQFGRWTFAGGKVLRGLIRRRAEEAALYASSANAPATSPRRYSMAGDC